MPYVTQKEFGATINGVFRNLSKAEVVEDEVAESWRNFPQMVSNRFLAKISDEQAKDIRRSQARRNDIRAMAAKIEADDGTSLEAAAADAPKLQKRDLSPKAKQKLEDAIDQQQNPKKAPKGKVVASTGGKKKTSAARQEMLNRIKKS